MGRPQGTAEEGLGRDSGKASGDSLRKAWAELVGRLQGTAEEGLSWGDGKASGDS